MVVEAEHLINAQALWRVEGVQVLVRITDVRIVWGKRQYAVSPEEGIGSRWVAESSITDITPQPK